MELSLKLNKIKITKIIIINLQVKTMPNFYIEQVIRAITIEYIPNKNKSLHA